MTDTTLDTAKPYTYEVTLHTPLFYASREGTVIETDPIVAATALMHAIGYDYYDLEKRYLLMGESTTTASYEHLRDLPFFTSEMVPTVVDANERTFRTVSYATERTLVSSNTDVGAFIRGSQKPIPRRIEGSNAGWHKMREFIGLAPGSKFEFTIWAPAASEPPAELGFRAGIKRSGELRAQRTPEASDTITLNQFLLQSIYDLDEALILETMRRAEEYRRGNDVRTNRFRSVDRAWVDEHVIPELLA